MGSGEAQTPWRELAASNGQRPKAAQTQGFRLHAPARSRTWIYRLGGGRLIHWTTRAHRSRRAKGRPEGYRRCAPNSALLSPASCSSSVPIRRWVIHWFICCAPRPR